MPRVAQMVMGGGMAGAIALLEAAERELVESRETADAQLTVTREAIAAMRKVVGGSQMKTSTPAAAKYPRVARLPAPAGAVMVSGPKGTGAAGARERAVLALIVAGAGETLQIRARLPRESGATDLQHRASVANALTRMKAKGLVANGGDKGAWVLSAKGRKAADAAKEEP